MSTSETFRRVSDVAWRTVGIGIVAYAVGVVLWRLRLVLVPVFIALLLCSALVPLVERLERRGWRTLLATWVVFLGFLAVVGGLLGVIVPRTASQLGDTGDAISQGLQDLEDWLVTGPFDMERSSVEEYTDDPGESLIDLARSSSDRLTEGAVLVGEALAGALLALVLTFLLLKDGRQLQAWALERTPHRHRELVSELAGAAWNALSGFLRGAALLGVVEGLIIGVAVWIVGGSLAVSIGLLTFLAAFFPIVGAVVAGAIASLVTLATAGSKEALIVLAVAIVVQQLDADLLAPFSYGRSLRLHPALVLVALSAGGILGGILGAFLAVPLTAVAVAVGSVVWRRSPSTPGP